MYGWNYQQHILDWLHLTGWVRVDSVGGELCVCVWALDSVCLCECVCTERCERVRVYEWVIHWLMQTAGASPTQVLLLHRGLISLIQIYHRNPRKKQKRPIGRFNGSVLLVDFSVKGAPRTMDSKKTLESIIPCIPLFLPGPGSGSRPSRAGLLAGERQDASCC